MTDMRAQVLIVALSWLGANEGSTLHHYIIDLYNSFRPLARGYRVLYTDEWCATFISALAIECGITDIMPTECGCEKMIALYKQLGRWIEDDAYTPQPGDIIFYDWQDSGAGDNTGTADHVGIVEYVEDGIVHTIEGNVGNTVGRRTVKLNGRYIRGYAVPDYESKSAPDIGDVSEWAKESCIKAVKGGIFHGDGDGGFRWHDGITREELAVVLDNLGLLG